VGEQDFRRLAGQLDAVWHSAGNVRLNDDLAVLRRVNVDGTRHVLDLVGAAAGRPALFQVSTAFVAGSRIRGTVYEDELDHGTGSENSYEQSKYEAEVLVREWSARHDRPVTVLRPGIQSVTTGQPRFESSLARTADSWSQSPSRDGIWLSVIDSLSGSRF
jgi:thioester reductase-like protein